MGLLCGFIFHLNRRHTFPLYFFLCVSLFRGRFLLSGILFLRLPLCIFGVLRRGFAGFFCSVGRCAFLICVSAVAGLLRLIVPLGRVGIVSVVVGAAAVAAGFLCVGAFAGACAVFFLPVRIVRVLIWGRLC